MRTGKTLFVSSVWVRFNVSTGKLLQVLVANSWELCPVLETHPWPNRNCLTWWILGYRRWLHCLSEINSAVQLTSLAPQPVRLKLDSAQTTSELSSCLLPWKQEDPLKLPLGTQPEHRCSCIPAAVPYVTSVKCKRHQEWPESHLLPSSLESSSY